MSINDDFPIIPIQVDLTRADKYRQYQRMLLDDTSDQIISKLMVSPNMFDEAQTLLSSPVMYNKPQTFNPVITFDHLENDIKYILHRYIGSKFNEIVKSCILSEIKVLFKNYVQHDRWPAGVSFPEVDFVTNYNGGMELKLLFPHNSKYIKFRNEIWKEEVKKDHPLPVKKDAPWYW